MTRARRLGLALAIALALPGGAQAQLTDVVGKLFDNFTDFGVFTTVGRFAPTSRTLSVLDGRNKQFPLRSYGAEFSWHIGEITRPYCVLNDDGEVVPRGCVFYKNRPVTKRVCETIRGDPVDIKVTADGTKYSETTTYKAAEQCTPPNERELFQVELGLAYVQQSRVFGKNSSGVQGTMKELPRVAIYATVDREGVAPYYGLVFGLTKLEDLQYVRADTTLTAPTAESAEAGFAFGLAGDELLNTRMPFSWFVEVGYTFSSFPNLKWASIKNDPAPPPKSLKLSNIGLSIGVQVEVRKKDAKED